jgi:hypothetical protein
MICSAGLHPELQGSQAENLRPSGRRRWSKIVIGGIWSIVVALFTPPQ